MTEQPPARDEAPTSRQVLGRDRRLIAVLVAACLAAAVLGYFFAVPLVLGSNKSSASAGPAPRQVTPSASPGASAKPTPPPVVPHDAPGVIGKDPYKPLVVVAAGSSGAPAAGAAAPADSTSPGAVPSSEATTPGMTTFKVLSVAGTKVTVSIDTKKYTASAGQVFATSYKVLSTDGSACATFAHGQMNFTLCEGQTFIF